MLEVAPSLLEQRRRLGLDRYDEMWEGVLHMVPAPHDEHQRLQDDLLVFLKPLLQRAKRGTLRSNLNVFDEASPVENYRIPDLTFVLDGHEARLAKDGVRGGGPDAVFEIRSPGDESYEKLPFYAKLGVREVVIVDRDTKRVEVFALGEGTYTLRPLTDDGAVTSETLRVSFRIVGSPVKLLVTVVEGPSASVEI